MQILSGPKKARIINCMWKLGILTKEQFLALGKERWRDAWRASCELLDVSDTATPDEIRVFEDFTFGFRTSNGTARMTFRNRFPDVNAAVLRWMHQLFPSAAALRVQDRAASHGLVSVEWAGDLFREFPHLTFEASDLMLELAELRLTSGEVFIAEMDGTPLQYIQPPFVVPLAQRPSRRYLVHHVVAARAKRRFDSLPLPEGWTNATDLSDGMRVRRISFIHPEARALMRHTERFTFRRRSIFEDGSTSGEGCCHVIRTMNILNRAYFSEALLREAASAIFSSLEPGGLWIVGRTLETDFSNHATLLRRGVDTWEVLERLGSGSEVEPIALGEPVSSFEQSRS